MHEAKINQMPPDADSKHNAEQSLKWKSSFVHSADLFRGGVRVSRGRVRAVIDRYDM